MAGPANTATALVRSVPAAAARQGFGLGLALALAAGLGSAGCDGEDPGGPDPYADALIDLRSAPETSFGHDRLPEVVLGPPGGLQDVASLGCGGEIILEFDPPGVVDGPGVDLIVFENPYALDFPEPGEVAVSDDGERWFEFPCDPATLVGCAGVTPTEAYPGSGIDPRDVERAGGDGFDLAALAGAPAEVRFVRVRDRSSEYWATRELGLFCDPGQQGAGGFDLDAIVAVHGG